MKIRAKMEVAQQCRVKLKAKVGVEVRWNVKENVKVRRN